MVAFRSRQRAYENTVAFWVLIASAVLCLVLFAVLDAWAQAPWLWIGTLALIGLLLAMPLTITVEQSQVRVSLAGVLRREIPLTDVVGVERRDYRPLREFGGWGWRYGLMRRNARAYTMTGATAVALTLRSGDEVYLGVADEAALLDVLAARIGA